jgi:lipopolysaccharide biosynthesis glycosyltransferase
VVIVAPPGHQQQAIAVLIGTVADHAAASVEFSVFARDSRSLELTALEAAAGGHRVRIIDTAGLGEDLRAAGRRASRADLDRLVLPELLHDLDRVVMLPAAAVVYADVAELAATDLGGHLIAAADPAGRPRTSGFGVLNTAANRLRNATAASAELRRRAYARHRFDFDAFATDVLVLDLAAWRARDIAGNYLAYVEEFGLSYRELLHFVVGPDRAVLAERWHAVPGRSAVADPALVHWGEPTKPWSSDLAPDRERWYAARDRLDRRALTDTVGR